MTEHNGLKDSPPLEGFVPGGHEYSTSIRLGNSQLVGLSFNLQYLFLNLQCSSSTAELNIMKLRQSDLSIYSHHVFSLCISGFLFESTNSLWTIGTREKQLAGVDWGIKKHSLRTHLVLYDSFFHPLLVGRASYSQIFRASFVPRNQATASLNQLNLRRVKH